MNRPASAAPAISLAPLPCPAHQTILPAPLLALLETLTWRYRPGVEERLAARAALQARLDDGADLDFPAETRELRQRDWRVAEIPHDLRDRRVEITGPVERKMVINALNAGARVFMADFEDSSAPTWSNMLDGQVNLRDAVRREITLTTPAGKHYRLHGRPAVLKVRPRGWHLVEKHVRVGGQPMPAGLFDAVVFLYHNAWPLIEQGSGPYLYLPKLENRFEARLWQQVLSDVEQYLDLVPGTIKVTVLIETITAVFEMDEILWELRDRVVGLNCGRWDYIFSYIKRFRAHPGRVLPDRAEVGMHVPFLHAYSRLLIQTCHRRGALAMGGMAAQIPVRDDIAANQAALDKVRADKEREVRAGHDGTWVAHPGLIPLAMEVFDRHMPGPNQLHRLREDVRVGAADLLAPCEGSITEAGVRGNIAVAVRYLAAWLGGQGCVPLDHLMEDAATAEIARAQLWQWCRHDAGRLEDGRDITLSLIREWLHLTCDAIRAEVGEPAYGGGHYQAAADLLAQATASDDFVEFITLPAYDQLD